MRHYSLALTAAFSFAASSPAADGPAEDFEALTDEYWDFVLRENTV